jgi:hypothetical protein
MWSRCFAIHWHTPQMNYRTAYKLRKFQALTQDPLLVALWGLILAKCCFLEHFVRQHAVPINTGIYVWLLSLFMAGLATVVLSGIVEPKVQHPDEKPDGPWLWPLTVSLMLVLLLLAFALGGNRLLAVLPLLCLPPGGAFALRCGVRFHPAVALQAVGWLVSAGILFMLSPPARILPVSCILILLVAVPGIFRFVQYRREIRQAMQALQK